MARGQGYGLYLTGEGAVLALRTPQDVAALRAGRRARFGHSPLILGAPSPGVGRVGYAGAGGYAATDAAPAAGAGGRSTPAAGAMVKLRLAGARADVQPEGVEPLPGSSNYFLGNDPARWRTGVPNYARVRYRGVYPGVDLIYYGNQRQLEHDFVIAAGADPSPIRLRFEGATRLKLDEAGNLLIDAGAGTLALQRPAIYQLAGGRRRPVRGGFRLLAPNTVGFALGAYDHGLPLVIDPVLSYASYLGGSDQDYAVSIAVDSAGDAYLTGLTFSLDFPITPGSFEAIDYATASNAVSTAFVAKLNASGTALVYSTYLGGDGTPNTQLLQGDYGHSIAVDSSGNAYVTGWTYSSNFPVTANAVQSVNYAALNHQATGFVSKLNATGSALVYSTYLGGSKLDEPTALAVDSGGNAYIAGYTYSNDFPLSGSAFQTSNNSYNNGGWNAFITKLSSDGSARVYSTYLGGSGETSVTAEGTDGPLDGTYAPMSIAVDSSGHAWVAGIAQSSDFPIAGNPYQRFNNAYAKQGTNLTLSELKADGSALLYSTYLGGSSYPGDFSTGLAIDGANSAYLTGYTYSSDFPVTPGAYQTSKPGVAQTAFASKINTTTGLVYSTFLGGSGSEDAYGLALDASGDLYLTGTTASSDFPVTPDAVQSTNNAATGGNTAFFTELNPAGSWLLYSTYLGGSSRDVGYGVALGSNGAAYLAGYTSSADFPVSADAFQTVYRAAQNTAFAAAFNIGSPPVTIATATSLQADANPQCAGCAITFTATVAPLSGTGVPAGNIAFSIDQVAVATVALDNSGKASYSSSGLALGDHYVLASYQGNNVYASSGDGLTESVLPPAITSLSPSTALAGGAGFSMTVNGAYFTSGALVNWNGVPLTTKYVSATQLTALVGQPRVANAGLVPVTVTTAGASSQPAIFTVTPGGSFPLVLGFWPAGATAGGAGFTLNVYGANFTAGSVVLWNGAARATSWVSSTELNAAIASSDIAQAGTASVSVSSPAPAFTTAAQPFPLASANPVAAITSASLAAAADGSGNHLLTLAGSGFVSGSAVAWQAGAGAPVSLSATYVSPWRLSAVVTGSEYSALASQQATITVTNPAGASQGFTLP